VEADIAERLKALLTHRELRTPWIYGGVVSSVKLARAMCAGAKPERGLRLYEQIGRTLETEVASAQEASHTVLNLQNLTIVRDLSRCQSGRFAGYPSSPWRQISL
jgi:hypothetical protein